jgi:hypothetical protein
MNKQLEEMQEQEAIQLFHRMCGKFGWVGCIFTDEDIRQRLADDDIAEEHMEGMVEAVKFTTWWRKTLDNVLCEVGNETLDEAIYEATNGSEA